MSRLPRVSRSGRLHSLLPRLMLAAGVALLLVSPPTIAQQKQPPKPPERLEPEVSPAAARFLQKVHAAKREVLLAEPGLTEGVVDKIMEYRAAGKKFANLLEFKRYTGISNADLETAMKPYRDQQRARRMEASRKPVPDPPSAGGPGGRVPPRGVQPVGDSAKGPIGDVRPGYYAKLPGYEDLDKLDPVIREEFLRRVNTEMCTCGCQHQSLAFCLVNDPGCPVVKARVKKIYEDVTTKPPR